MWVERLNSNQAHMDTHLYGRCSYSNKMIETQIGKLFLFFTPPPNCFFFIVIERILKVKGEVNGSGVYEKVYSKG